MQHVTIKEIASALGVSISTVSRALNDKYDVKKETQKRVMEMAEKMGYRPNPIARKLISRKTFLIGVIVPEFTNSFFPEVIKGMQHFLSAKKYQLLIMSSEENTEIERENLKTMEYSMADGILISLTCESTNTAYIEKLIEQELPIVMFNRIAEQINCPKVVFDDYKWAFEATEHLIQQGYKQVIHFSGPAHLSFAQNRISGFKDALLKYALPFSEESVIESGLFIDGGSACMEKLIQAGKLPEAVLAVNDPAAIGAIRTLKKHGFRIPEDVAITGFSQCAFADLIDPPLTSIEQPTTKMGEIAAAMLMEIIDETATKTFRTEKLDGKLHIRQSSLRK